MRIAALAVLALLGSPALAQKKAAVPSAQAYAASIEGVDCSNLVQRHSLIKPLLPIIRSAIKRKAIRLEKDEFETTAQFQARKTEHFAKLLGGTDRIVLAVPLEHSLSYDADNAVMTISGAYQEDLYHYGSDYANRQHTIQLFRDAESSETYDASNAYGATVEVERTNKIRAALLFPPGQLPPIPPLKMAAGQARIFKADPVMLVVARLRPPYFHYSYDRLKATIDFPYETRLSSYAFHVNMECAVFATGASEVYRLSPDNPD